MYREEVKVDTPSLVLRGTDRNAVVVDGEFTRPNAISVTADAVAVEDLTVRNGRLNGLFWTGVSGYRASSVTAINNEVYGIYAFDSVDGLFENSWASGSADAGFYIGQCNPCNDFGADLEPIGADDLIVIDARERRVREHGVSTLAGATAKRVAA